MAIEMSITAAEDTGWQVTRDGDDATMDIGAQGGFHVWMRARASGVCSRAATLHYEVHTVASGAFIVEGIVAHALAPAEDGKTDVGWLATEHAQPVILCPPPQGTDVIDQELRITTTLTDDTGRAAVAEHTVRTRCPTANPDVHTTCRRICDRLE
jgi:hypothetical protein